MGGSTARRESKPLRGVLRRIRRQLQTNAGAGGESGRTLVEKAVDSVDRRGLVVAAQQEKVLGVPDLVSEQQADGLEAILAAVDVVAARAAARARGVVRGVRTARG